MTIHTSTAPHSNTVYCVQQVRFIDVHNQSDSIQTVWIHNGHIVAMGNQEPPMVRNADITVIDGTDLWLTAAFVDLCARLREPGHQQHGSLASEGLAARSNGFLHIVMPPDTDPILESGSLLKGLSQKAWDDGRIHLHLLGALTQALNGKQPANLASLKKGGAIGVTNATCDFSSHEVMLRVLQYAASTDLTVFFYPEDASLASNGCVHDGFTAAKLGLPAIPSIAETAALAVQLQMVALTGVKAHFSQLSTAGAVALIRAAKANGMAITADVALHQLLLNDTAILGFNALAHVRPPLRDESDRLALLAGLADGTIDAVCSHHAPLSASSKQAPFAETAAGLSTVDSFVPLSLQLISANMLTPLQWLTCITTAPATIAGIDSVYQQTGGYVLIDPNYTWSLTADTMLSQGKNTPFIGAPLTGKVIRTFY